jgi:hypothetical protein
MLPAMTSPTAARLNAALAHRYRIERKLGEGGMASVYLAEDVKHERKVAVKILRPELAAVIGSERFLTEIKTTANLQHPHILALFDSGEADGFLYYVMPYVEGETLRERLERERQLGVDEAVRIARDVADALDYAHRAGVIHRDIKPANILLHDGRPVVADFGIALAVSAAGGGRMTETGLSLGTPHYMSPEQASADRDLSARSDVYSLGCVLYEMLAGQPPHTGPSAQNILVRILTEAARPVTELRHTVPPHVAAVVSKAIEKLPADRFDSAKAFRDALDDESFTYAARPGPTVTAAAPLPAGPTRRPRALLAAVAILALSTLGFGWMALAPTDARSDAPAPVVSFVLAEPYGTGRAPVIAPDGSILYYDRSAENPGFRLRAAGSLETVRLDQIEVDGPGGSSATFSPDSRWLAFVADEGEGSTLRRMPAQGGPTRLLWSGGEGGQARFVPEWGDDGWIYLEIEGALARVPEEGGPADTLLATPGQRIQRIEALPEGRGLVFSLSDSPSLVRTVLMDLRTRDTTTLLTDGFDARYVESGHLIYAHPAGALYAIPFDARALELTGSPVPVIDDLSLLFGYGRFDVSAGGTLAYAQGTGGEVRDEGWIFGLTSPDGTVRSYPLEPTDHPDASLSPDGRRLAYTRSGGIWIYDTELGSNEPLSERGADTGEHHDPVWSPDGSEVVFERRAEGGGLFVQRIDGTAEARRIAPVGNPSQWLDDGTILYGRALTDIYAVSATGDGPDRPILRADWVEARPRVSPDGRWLLFVSTETGGDPALHMRRWPDLTDRVVVATEIGFLNGSVPFAFWSRDARRIYYTSRGGDGGTLMEATLGDGDPPEISLRDTGHSIGSLRGIHPDGSLLEARSRGMWYSLGGPGPQPRLVVVTNWLTALERELGGGS